METGDTQSIGGWTFQSAAEVLNAEYPKLPWLVHETIPLGGLALLSSKPKVGKSTLARCLAVSVAQGRRWLNREVTQGTVLYCCLEESEPFVQAHLKQLGMNDADPLRVHYHEPKEKKPLPSLEEAIKVYGATLLIVDPIMFLIGVQDLNDYATTTTALRPFHAMARETGVSILLVHHNNKRTVVSPGDEILGSTSLFGIVDVALSMSDGRQGRTLYSKPRYGTPIEPLELRLDGDGWVRAGRPVAEIESEETEDKILAFLAGRTEPTDSNTIREGIGGKTARIKAKLAAMVKAGQVELSGAGVRGKPKLYSIPVPNPREGMGTETEMGEQDELFPFNEPDFARPI